MKTDIVPQIEKKTTLQVAEYVATISPGETVAYIDYLTGGMCVDYLTRLLVEHSARRLQRGRVQEPAGRHHLHPSSSVILTIITSSIIFIIIIVAREESQSTRSQSRPL